MNKKKRTVGGGNKDVTSFPNFHIFISPDPACITPIDFELETTKITKGNYMLDDLLNYHHTKLTPEKRLCAAMILRALDDMELVKRNCCRRLGLCEHRDDTKPKAQRGCLSCKVTGNKRLTKCLKTQILYRETLNWFRGKHACGGEGGGLSLMYCVENLVDLEQVEDFQARIRERVKISIGLDSLDQS